VKPALDLLREMRRRAILKIAERPSEHSPKAPPEDWLRGSPCSYFWGRTIKGPCARCGHTYREHLGELADGGKG